MPPDLLAAGKRRDSARPMAEFEQFSLCNTRVSLDCLALGLLLLVVSDGLSQPRWFGPLPHCCLHRTDTSLGDSVSYWLSPTRGRSLPERSCCHRGQRIFPNDSDC